MHLTNYPIDWVHSKGANLGCTNELLPLVVGSVPAFMRPPSQCPRSLGFSHFFIPPSHNPDEALIPCKTEIHTWWSSWGVIGWRPLRAPFVRNHHPAKPLPASWVVKRGSQPRVGVAALGCHLEAFGSSPTLMIPFQLRPEVEPMYSSIEYLHKRFDWTFVKDYIISTKSYCPAKSQCTFK
jgi:hypothetical protein